MLRLWGRLSSINVRKVVWAAQELGLPLQRTDAGGSSAWCAKRPTCSATPNGLVPLMEDDDTGLVLWNRTPSCATCAQGIRQASFTLRSCPPGLWPSSGWTGSRPR